MSSASESKGTRGIVEMRLVGATDWKALDENSARLCRPEWSARLSSGTLIRTLRYTSTASARSTQSTTGFPSSDSKHHHAQARRNRGFDANHLPVLYDQANYKPPALVRGAGRASSPPSQSHDLHYQAAVYNRVNGDTQLGHHRAGWPLQPPAPATQQDHAATLATSAAATIRQQSSDCRAFGRSRSIGFQPRESTIWRGRRTTGHWQSIYRLSSSGLGKSRNLPMIDFRIRWIW